MSGPRTEVAQTDRGFAALYSLGNVLALLGTFFLAGPMRPVWGSVFLGNLVAQLFSGTHWHPFSFFLVAAPLKMVFPKKGSLLFQGH